MCICLYCFQIEECSDVYAFIAKNIDAVWSWLDYNEDLFMKFICL